MTSFVHETFKGKDYIENPFPKGEYDNCTFDNCTFESIHLSNLSFLECTFNDCNLTNVKWGGTSLNTITFNKCKLLGTDFSICNPFMLNVSFKGCILDFAVFFNLPINKTSFKDSSCKEADFTGADLSTAVFENCDLSRTQFEQTNLEKTDFSTAYNFSIDPNENRVKETIFSKENIKGLKSIYNKRGLSIYGSFIVETRKELFLL